MGQTEAQMTAEIQLRNVDGQQQDFVASLRAMAEHLAGDTANGASKAASSLAHAAADLVEHARKDAGPILRKAGEEIRDYPVSTVAIVTASIGLISYAFSRNDKAPH